MLPCLFQHRRGGGEGEGEGEDEKIIVCILFLQLYDVIVLRRKGWCRILEIIFLMTMGLLTIFHLVQAPSM